MDISLFKSDLTRRARNGEIGGACEKVLGLLASSSSYMGIPLATKGDIVEIIYNEIVPQLKDGQQFAEFVYKVSSSLVQSYITTINSQWQLVNPQTPNTESIVSSLLTVYAYCIWCH
jgi:hypothetical protein